MDYFWIFGAAVLLMFLFSRVRTRRGQAGKTVTRAGPRVQGFQVAAFVHPRMSAQCLFDDGVQFGDGFRRKEPPHLPHDGQCRCETLPFSFGSDEVFKGALRRNLENQGAISGLPLKENSRLIGRLKAVEVESLPESAGEFLEKVELARFPHKFRHDIEMFLNERYQFLSAQEQATRI